VVRQVQKPMEYLDKVAQSSESLPNDYSTNSLLKNVGQNLTAQKLSQTCGKDYKKMILIILQKANVIGYSTLKDILL